MVFGDRVFLVYEIDHLELKDVFVYLVFRRVCLWSVQYMIFHVNIILIPFHIRDKFSNPEKESGGCRLEKYSVPKTVLEKFPR